MRRRLIIAAVVLILLTVAGVLAWSLADMPPPGLVLRYGYPSPMGPTERTMTVEGVELVEISPGYFRMGSHYHCDEGDLLGRISSAVGLAWGRPPVHWAECPVHLVEFENGFWIARTEVTNAQYERFDPKHRRRPSSPGDRDPVVNTNWLEAKRYCAWLSSRSGLAIRLPSEAEWECACRAGSTREFCFGEDENQLESYAWYGKNSDGRAHHVGALRGNAWGLQDCHGNVLEWCEDAFRPNYDGAPADGTPWTQGSKEGLQKIHHVLRGGCWLGPGAACRSAQRVAGPAWLGRSHIGFRPAFTPPPEEGRP